MICIEIHIMLLPLAPLQSHLVLIAPLLCHTLLQAARRRAAMNGRIQVLSAHPPAAFGSKV